MHGDPVALHIGIHENDRPDYECRHTADADGAEARQEKLRHYQGNADENERDTGIVHRQHMKGV